MSEELKPCRLCGHEMQIHGNKEHGYLVRCINGRCPLSTGVWLDKRELITAWNHRPAQPVNTNRPASNPVKGLKLKVYPIHPPEQPAQPEPAGDAVECEHGNTVHGDIDKHCVDYELCLDCGLSRSEWEQGESEWTLNPHALLAQIEALKADGVAQHFYDEGAADASKPLLAKIEALTQERDELKAERPRLVACEKFYLHLRDEVDAKYSTDNHVVCTLCNQTFERITGQEEQERK